MEVCFRQATLRDVAAMMTLWKQCFPEDDEGFIRRFFDQTPISAGFVSCKGDVLASLFLLPAEVLYNGEVLPVRYLYAGCTHPAHRKQGLYAALMSYAAEWAQKNGNRAIYLHPANEPLWRYYQKLGYRAGIGWYCGHPSGEDSAKYFDFASLTASAYLEQRTQYLPDTCPVWQLCPEYTRFFLEEMIADGWRPIATNTGCGVLSPDGVMLYDALARFRPVAKSSCGYFPGGEWADTALWLPLGEGIPEEPGYTAFLGDI